MISFSFFISMAHFLIMVSLFTVVTRCKGSNPWGGCKPSSWKYPISSQKKQIRDFSCVSAGKDLQVTFRGGLVSSGLSSCLNDRWIALFNLEKVKSSSEGKTYCSSFNKKRHNIALPELCNIDYSYFEFDISNAQVLCHFPLCSLIFVNIPSPESSVSNDSSKFFGKEIQLCLEKRRCFPPALHVRRLHCFYYLMDRRETNLFDLVDIKCIYSNP